MSGGYDAKMSIEKMNLVKVTGHLEKMNAALIACFEGGYFHPELLSEKSGGHDAYHPYDAVNPYLPVLSKLGQIAKECGTDFAPEQTIGQDKIEQAANLLLGVGSRHPASRFGKMPTAQVDAFRQKSGKLFTFLELMEKVDESWCIYSADPSVIEEADAAAKAAGFVLMWAPDFSKGDAGVSDFAFEKELHQLEDQKQLLLAAKERGSSAVEQLAHMENLNVSLDDIFACKYLEVRFGRIPLDNAGKLKYYDDRLFFFQPLSEDGDFQWGFFFTDKIHVAEMDEILSSLYFERVYVPEYVHGVPGQTFQHMKEAVEEADRELTATDELMKETVGKTLEMCRILTTMLEYLSRSFELRRYVSVYEDSFFLVGFIPAAEADGLVKKLHAIDEDIAVELAASDSDKRFQAPTKLKNNFIVKPFEMFVDMYGLPGYNETDPTSYLAITYILLFGIMFGDLGQGLVIAALGLFLDKVKDMDFGRILERIGLSAAVFGTIYGSVFGLEHVLDPFYINVLGLPGKPVEIMDGGTINTLLIVAIAVGVAMIVIAMLINVITGLRHKDWEKAFFSNNGVAGLVFYGAVLAGMVSMLTGGPNLFTAPYILAFLVLPILVIFLKDPLGKLARGEKHIKPEDGIASFCIEGFFELFEVVLSFVTNTLSFMRVGGFIISHAGMMSVVLTLTEMFTGAGSIVVLIIGNLFVMGLEGFIVGIQSLRLEFYEMFSRYFEGQGTPYAPVRMDSQAAGD